MLFSTNGINITAINAINRNPINFKSQNINFDHLSNIFLTKNRITNSIPKHAILQYVRTVYLVINKHLHYTIWRIYNK